MSSKTPLPTDSPAEATESGLPIDLRATAIGLWKRRAVPAAFLLLSVPAAILCALLVGSRTYRAETVLLYKPVLIGGEVASDLQTQMHMVKVQGNLEEAGARLSPPLPATAMGAATEVRIQKDTDLLFISAVANDAQTAAKAADALREVFLENQNRVRRAEADRRVQELSKRLDEVRASLVAADRNFADFTARNQLIDLEKETGSYLQEQMSLAVLHQQALGDRMAVEQQAANLQSTIAGLRKKAAAEEAQSSGNEDLSSLNIRIGRLRSAIEEDRRFRAAAAILAQREIEFERLKRLHADGLVSDLELKKLEAEVDEQRALATDTDEIKQWKTELGRLDQGVIPKKNGDTPSNAMLREVMLRSFDIELQRTAIAEKVKQLEIAQEKVREKLQALPALQTDYIGVRREIEARETEVRTIQDTMVRLRSAYESGAADFTVVAPARVPAHAESSTRRALFAAVVVAGLLLGLLLAAAGEVGDRTIRTGAEVRLRVGRPLLAVIPSLKGLDPHDLLLRSPASLEPFRRLALQIRRAVPRAGARVLIVGSTPGEGATFTAASVAACLGRQGERVVIVDANVRRLGEPARAAQGSLADEQSDNGMLLPRHVEAAVSSKLLGAATRASALIPPPVKRQLRRAEPLVQRTLALASAGARWTAHVVKGERQLSHAQAPLDLNQLVTPAASTDGDLERYLNVDGTVFEQVVRQSDIPGVDVIASRGIASQPDLIGTNRMRQLLYEASSRYGIVLVDAPAGLSSADAEALAPWVDCIVLVVRSQQVDARWVRAVAERLAATGTTLLGAVLNGTDRRYMLRNEMLA